ncbi:MAG: hypothetical protein HRU24_13740 [Gammaproteobacteria bacterium]|nr:hypothetical protein [Gammaproteobacteria bacterium]
MNITTNYQNVSLVTTNPATDRVVQDNSVRQVIPATEPVLPTLKEQPVAAQRDKTNPKVTTSESPTYDLPANATPEEIEKAREQQGGSSQGKEEQQNPQQQDEKPSDTGSESRYSDVEQKKIDQLSERNLEVIAHEMAHATVGGQYSGSPNYAYKTGPDGTKYAVSGEVSIDTSKVPNNPQATLRKARQIKAAALAPTQPSSQDRRVAMKADRMAAQARQQILTEGHGVKSTSFQPANQIESDSFNRRIQMSQDSDFQATLKSRSLHISNYYQNSSQIAKPANLNQQI